MLNIWSLIRLEAKLLLRGPMVWLMLIITGVLAYLVYSTERYTTNLLLFTQQFSFIYTAPLTIAAVMAGVYGAGRDRAMKVDRVMGALPYSSIQLYTARIVLSTLPYVLMNLLPAGILVYLALTREQGVSGLGSALLVQCVQALCMIYPVLLGWAVGMKVPGKWSYFVGFILWLVHSILGLAVLNMLLPHAWYALPNFMMFDYVSMGYLDTVWGFLLDVTFWSHRGMYVALALLLALLIIRRSAAVRKEPIHRMWYRITLIVMSAAVISCMAGYVGIRQERVNGYQDWERQAEAQAVVVTAKSELDFTISDYRLKVTQDKGSNLHVEALLILDQVVDKSLDRLELTLHPKLKVNSVKLNGQTLPFQKQGYLLSLLPESPLLKVRGAQLELAYGGELDEWELVRAFGNEVNTKLVPSYRVSEDQWYLPGMAAWYPLPGRTQLSYREEGEFVQYSEWYTSYPSHLTKARFEVELHHRPGLTLFGNGNINRSQAGEGVTSITGDIKGLSLVAGALQEVEGEGAMELYAIYGQTIDSGYVKELLTEVGNQWAEAKRILEIDVPQEAETLLAVDPSVRYGGENLGGIELLNGSQITDREKPEWIMEDYIRRNISAHHLQASGGKGDPYMLVMIMGAYLRSDQLNKPVNIAELYPYYVLDNGKLAEPFDQFESYMNTHTKEEVERLLKKLYEVSLGYSGPPREMPLDHILD